MREGFREAYLWENSRAKGVTSKEDANPQRFFPDIASTIFIASLTGIGIALFRDFIVKLHFKRLQKRSIEKMRG